MNIGGLWQRRFDEKIEGSLYTTTQYDQASARSGYELYSAYASVDLNSVSTFLAGNFLIPGIAEVGVGLPIAGRNAVAEPVVHLQGTVFF